MSWNQDKAKIQISVILATQKNSRIKAVTAVQERLYGSKQT